MIAVDLSNHTEWRWFKNPLLPHMVYLKNNTPLTYSQRLQMCTYCEQILGEKGTAWDKEGAWFYFRTESDAVQFLLAFS